MRFVSKKWQKNSTAEEEEDDELGVPYLRSFEGVKPDYVVTSCARSMYQALSCKTEEVMRINPDYGQTIDVEKFIEMTSLEVPKNAYYAISYKHMIEFKEPKDFRNIVASPSYRREVEINLTNYGAPGFWHDGVKAFWKKDRYRCRGLYPYLLDQGTVMVCLPSPSDNVVDPGEWVPDRYPMARNAMLEAMGWLEVDDDLQVFVKRTFGGRKPSLAWGSFNSVWMLAESFCGCLTGRIKLTDRSKRAAQCFIGEVQFASRLIESYQATLRGQVERCCSPCAKKRIPLYWTDERCSRALRQLFLLADEVREYLKIVLNPSGAGAIQLSEMFVEKIPHASYSVKTDLIMVGALCSFMLQRVAGKGAAPPQALQELELHQDPLGFCLLVASSGQFGFGGGTSWAQRLGAALRAIERDSESNWNRQDLIGLSDLWPQPVYGPGFAGSASTSAWKEVFWTALEERRCLGWEAADEKAQFGDLVENVIKVDRKTRIQAARRYRRSVGKWCMGNRAADAMELLEKTKARIKGLDVKVMTPFTAVKSDNDVRVHWIRQLRQSWHRAQSALMPVIGSTLPLVFDIESNLVMLYMIDTGELGGHALDSLKEDCSNVWVVPGEDYQPGHMSIHSDLGQAIQMPLSEYPLYQMAFAIRGKAVHMVLRRRIWARVSHVQAPIHLDDLKRLADTPIRPGGAHFEDPFDLKDDDLLPIRLFRKKMADYTHTYDVVRSREFMRRNSALMNMWQQIRVTKWTEPGNGTPPASSSTPVEEVEDAFVTIGESYTKQSSYKKHKKKSKKSKGNFEDIEAEDETEATEPFESEHV